MKKDGTLVIKAARICEANPISTGFSTTALFFCDRTVLSRMASTALEEMGLKRLETGFGNRVAYGESILSG